MFTKGVALEYRALTFIFLSVSMMVTDTRFSYLDKIRYGLGYATAPIYWVADVPARVSFWIDDVFVSHTDLVEENERLREELLLSQRELQLLESLASENSRLLELRDASEIVGREVLPAEIINVSPDPFSKRILINKGSRDGAFVGQALLDANGLMGQVVEVLPFTSWVMLITDSHHVTPVQVNRNGERALARGSRDNTDTLELEFVTHTQDMLAGDKLVSSGMGQIYPKNYPVAEITSVFADPGQPFATITARPLAKIASTRHVMLVFDGNEQVEAAAETDTLDTAPPTGGEAPDSPDPASDQPPTEEAPGATVLEEFVESVRAQEGESAPAADVIPDGLATPVVPEQG